MMYGEKGVTLVHLVLGILSFFRSERIVADLQTVHGAFKELKESGFELLKYLPFTDDGISRNLFDCLNHLLVSDFISYYGTQDSHYSLKKESLRKMREELPAHFTANEIIQLSEIAERLEDMLKVEV